MTAVSAPARGLDPDLADPTIRQQYFGGLAADRLAADCPIFPLTAPGLPPLPPNIVAQAVSFGDAPAAVPAGRGRKKPVFTPGPVLHALVRSLLYQYDRRVLVPTEPSVMNWFTFLPGMGFGDKPRVGPDPLPLFIIGKCLGQAEEQARRPFVGSGSDPLWDAWHDVGLAPPAGWAYATNLIRFAPPPEYASRLPASWVADGKYLLFQELLLGRPKWVLALGADAVKSLLGKTETLESCRGLVRELPLDLRRTPSDEPPGPDDVHVVKVVAVDHPAAAARDPDKIPLLVAGLRFLANQAGGDLPTTGQTVLVDRVITDYQPVYTLAELRREAAESARAAARGGYLSLDCEWHGRHPVNPGAFLYTVQWSHGPGHGRCVFLKRCGGVDNPELPEAETREALAWLFGGAAARGTRLVTHFGKGDLTWLAHYGVDLTDAFEQPVDADGVTGVQRTYREGGFDTFIALHAVEETGPRKLEVAANMVLGMDRWDAAKDAETLRVCADVLDCKKTALPGYGFHAEDVIAPYGCGDVDAAGRLYLHLNGDPRKGTFGLLDKDRFGNSSRRVYHLRMRAWPAWTEMEATGLLVDGERNRELREKFAAKRDALLAQIRREVNWPELDLAKPNHRIELFYGEDYHDKGRLRPAGAATLGLTPFKATAAAGGYLWDEAVHRHQVGQGPKPKPSVDRESVADARAHPVADLYYQMAALRKACETILRAPDAPDVPDFDGETDVGSEPAEASGDFGDEERFSGGLMKEVCADGRVRSLFGMTETGRGTSSKPNLFNIGGDTSKDKYDYIFKNDGGVDQVRTMFVAPPGHLLLWADLKGAEIAVAAWASGDPLLAEHARLANEGLMDLHADLAVRSFRLVVPDRPLTAKECADNKVAAGTTVATLLGCKPGDPLPANKKALALAGKLHLRTASKRTRFGHYYGAEAATLLRKIREETDAKAVTQADVEGLIHGHDEAYPYLADTFAAARARREVGWLCGPYGSYRRVRRTSDRRIQGDQERELQNFICQNPVADAVNTWLALICDERRKRGLHFKLLLSVYDSVMLEVPEAEIEEVADQVVLETLTTRVPYQPCTLDGRPITTRGPYFFGADVKVGRRWEDELPEEDWRAVGRAAKAALPTSTPPAN